MINSKLDHVKSVEEFNSEIKRQQEEAHGDDYCQIHSAIEKYMKECDSYMELGTHQGGTASAAMLTNPKRIQLVDIDLSRYRKVLNKLAPSYCQENGIELELKECDSRSLESIEMRGVDMLMIDSLHKAPFMRQELDVHGPYVRKYIIAHDTSIINGRANDSLYKCLVDFGNRKGWKVIERGTTNVGYTVLAKKQ